MVFNLYHAFLWGLGIGVLLTSVGWYIAFPDKKELMKEGALMYNQQMSEAPTIIFNRDMYKIGGISSSTIVISKHKE